MPTIALGLCNAVEFGRPLIGRSNSVDVDFGSQILTERTLFEGAFPYCTYHDVVPRPRKFDVDHVIDSAMELFWTRGYEATSLSDLTAELGIHPGSLYRTFGDKHALFLRALERYHETRALRVGSALLAGGPVLPRIRGVLIGLIEIAAEETEPRGCLVANAVGELLPSDKAVGKAVSISLAEVERAFLQGLRLAEEQGEIPAGLDLPGWALALTMLIQGLQVIVKVDPDPRRLTRSVDAVFASLDGGPGCRHGSRRSRSEGGRSPAGVPVS